MLFRELDRLRPQLANVAQAVLDGWDQDEEGFSEDFGYGGADLANP